MDMCICMCVCKMHNYRCCKYLYIWLERIIMVSLLVVSPKMLTDVNRNMLLCFSPKDDEEQEESDGHHDNSDGTNNNNNNNRRKVR